MSLCSVSVAKTRAAVYNVTFRLSIFRGKSNSVSNDLTLHRGAEEAREDVVKCNDTVTTSSDATDYYVSRRHALGGSDRPPGVWR